MPRVLVAIPLPMLMTLAACAQAPRAALLLDGNAVPTASIRSLTIDRDSVEAELDPQGDAATREPLVRWGEPQPHPTARSALVLDDGGVLYTDRPWSPAGLARIDERSIALRRGKQWIEFPRERVRRIVLSSEAASSDPLEFQADPSSDGLPTVQLRSGDRLAGRVESLDQNSLKLEIAGESIDTPTDSVAAVSLPGPPSQAVAAVLVGIADGSLLRAESVSLVDGGVRVVLVGGVELKCDAEQLAFVQPLAGQARYLSDLDAIDYRHTPYLDIAWPYSRDRGLRGQPLVGGGVRSVKGLAMHSAARLVYRLDGSAQRFHAEVAVADPAPDASGGKGLIARVYLARDGKFEPVYDSGELRAGDPAAPVRIDAKGAVGIALVVDYGAGGDAGDECLWLDARLVPGS